MTYGIFFNNIKNLSKKRDTDHTLHLGEVFDLICKNEINQNNIGLIVNSHMKWEIIVATNCLKAPQLESHLKSYLGVDITDDEMTDSVFGKPRRLIK